MNQRSKLLRWIGCFLAIAWVLVLSEFVFSNLKSTTELREQLASQNPHAALLALETKVVELSRQVGALEDVSAKANQSELDALQRHWDEQFRALQSQNSQYTSMYTSADDFMQVVQELKALQERIDSLEQKMSSSKPVQPVATTEASKVAVTTPQNTKPVTASPVIAQPPFKILGIELRQGEQVLSLLPNRSTSIADSRLLRVGEQYRGWTLTGLNHQEAVFKVGGRTRTLKLD